MQIAPWVARARDLAEHLRDALGARGFDIDELHADPIGYVRHVMGLVVEVAPPSAGCSVAGSYRDNRITVAAASASRQSFTVLHELGHHLSDHATGFFDAALAADRRTIDRDVVEDACEAFAASVLLLEEDVDALLAEQACTVRAFTSLLDQRGNASLEACAVAFAHRLPAPGYVVLCERDGTLRFAARSGDALPLARGCDQNGTVLDNVLRGQATAQLQGALKYRSGSLTPRHYADVARWEQLVVAVLVADHAGWVTLHLPDISGLDDRKIEAFCDHCDTEFTAWRNDCPHGQAPLHELCGRCSCDQVLSGPIKACTRCGMELSVLLVSRGATLCDDHG